MSYPETPEQTTLRRQHHGAAFDAVCGLPLDMAQPQGIRFLLGLDPQTASYELPTDVWLQCFRPPDKAAWRYSPPGALSDWLDVLAAVARAVPGDLPTVTEPVHLNSDGSAAIFYSVELLLGHALSVGKLSPVGCAVGMFTILIAEQLDPQGQTYRIDQNIFTSFGADPMDVPGTLAPLLDRLYSDANTERKYATPEQILWLFEAARFQPGLIERCDTTTQTGFRVFQELRENKSQAVINPDLVINYLMWKLDREPTDPPRVEGQINWSTPVAWAVRLTGLPRAGRLVRYGLLATVVTIVAVVSWIELSRFRAERVTPIGTQLFPRGAW